MPSKLFSFGLYREDSNEFINSKEGEDLKALLEKEFKQDEKENKEECKKVNSIVEKKIEDIKAINLYCSFLVTSTFLNILKEIAKYDCIDSDLGVTGFIKNVAIEVSKQFQGNNDYMDSIRWLFNLTKLLSTMAPKTDKLFNDKIRKIEKYLHATSLYQPLFLSPEDQFSKELVDYVKSFTFFMYKEYLEERRNDKRYDSIGSCTIL